MANLLKHIVLDQNTLDICDDTARSAASTATSTANENKTNISSLTTRVSTLEGKSHLTATYSADNSTLTFKKG